MGRLVSLAEVSRRLIALSLLSELFPPAPWTELRLVVFVFPVLMVVLTVTGSPLKLVELVTLCVLPAL